MLPRRTWARLSLAMLLSAAIGGCVTENRAERAPASPRLRAGSSNPTLAPLAFVRFCMRNGTQCQPTGQPDEIVQATPQAMAAIDSVNRQVNARIRPSEKEAEWRINPATGNCNDYVVSKRHALLASGFPSSALLISVVRTPSGQGHLVLIVRTNREDLVLDNLTTSVLSVAETPYLWIKRQTSIDPRQWEMA